MYGKLGHGNENGCSTPKRVEALSDLNIALIACGSRHTAVATATGKLYSWGDKENGVAGHGDSEGHQYTPKLLEKLSDETIVQLSACGFHTGCITKDGEVYTWGEGKFGRLGHGNERNCHSPKLVENLIGKKPKQIACGGFHSAVITEDGKMYTFGGGEHGQLGQGEKVNQEIPTLVKALDGIFISQITCGWSHSVALTSRGHVYTFGNGDHGKLGHGSGKKVATPHLVEKLKNHKVVKVASYNEHTAALVEPVHDSGAIWGAFGSNTVTVSSSFICDMKDMVDNDEFADLIFIVNNERVYAHRSILASRCEHFAAMFRSGMRESVEKEIHIPNVTKPVFLLLMEFLYTETVTIEIEYAVELYILSDLYQLERLKNICITVIKRKMSLDNAASILQIAADEGCQIVKDICMEFIVTNFETFSKSESIRLLSHSLLLEILENRP
jgi:RCC1 and BTB domain-containing protein